MRKFIFLFSLFVFTILCACSGVTPEWQAANAAKDYYDCLKDGNAIGFLEGKAGVDSQPSGYGEQLLKAVKQYHADLQQKHGGLREVRIVDERYQQDSSELCDTILHFTYAYLMLCYGDSTQEEIVVPMIEHDGQWLMK